MRQYRGVILLAAGIFLAGWPGVPAQAQSACTHYASPNGGGNGSSYSSPFKITDFWSKAKPGDTLCLLDGTYRGGDSMITPPDGFSGQAGRPVTVRAVNDGGATIDGQEQRSPLRMYNNAWIVVEGVNAHSSKMTSDSQGNVVVVSRSQNIVIRRIVAWDASPASNSDLTTTSNSKNVLFEDMAGFGTGRKIWIPYQSDSITYRRVWGRWDGSITLGPKVTASFSYHATHTIFENVIGTWSSEKLPSTYRLTCNDGQYTGHPRCGDTYTGYDVDQPYAIFTEGPEPDSRVFDAKMLGSIAYIRAEDRFQPAVLVEMMRPDIHNIEIKDVAAYVEPANRDKDTFKFNSNGRGLKASNLTAIGGNAPNINSTWQTSNIVHGSSVSQTGDIYTNPKGARICKRYVNGQLTNEPLWPWPMNQRIIDAMKQAGRAPVDVTATIERLFGPIPAECRGSGGPFIPGPCHRLDAAQAVPAGYGAAYNVHSAQKELLVTAQCEANGTKTDIGNGDALLYVYHSGWGWNGSQWVQQSYACDGENISNAWCVGKAKGTVPSGTPWFVGYTCFWNGAAWKCGCRDSACGQSYWQLQGIDR